jgi:hypothetical protein
VAITDGMGAVICGFPDAGLILHDPEWSGSRDTGTSVMEDGSGSRVTGDRGIQVREAEPQRKRSASRLKKQQNCPIFQNRCEDQLSDSYSRGSSREISDGTGRTPRGTFQTLGRPAPAESHDGRHVSVRLQRSWDKSFFSYSSVPLRDRYGARGVKVSPCGLVVQS